MNRREMCVLFGGAAAMTGMAAGGWAKAAPASPPRDGLERTAPHKAGVDADAVLGWLDAMAAAGMEMDSFMVYRAGHVAAEGWWRPYQPDFVHMLHSSTKSFTGTGVGIAIHEGLIRLDDPVLKFFPGRVKTPGANLQAMTVESLLTQTSGHKFGVSGSSWRPIKTSWVDEFFKVPVEYPPDTHFAYSSGTSFLLSAIVTQVTGQSLDAYMRPRFFDPMGMTSARWDVGPENINPGGNGLSTTTADFLKLGVVHLHGGQWQGRQVVPQDWARAVAQPTHGNDYSYHWWIAPRGLGYFAAGKFGQFCFVFPGLDAVLAFTGGVPDNEETRNKVHAMAFDHIGPICGQAAPDRTAEAEARLTARIKDLAVLPPLSPQGSPRAARISGRTFACADNADGVKSIALAFEGDRCRFTLTDDRGTHTVENGLKAWRLGETTLTGGYLHHEYEPDHMKVVAGGRWGAPDRFDMTWQFVESGFRDSASITLDGDTVRYDRGVNVNSGPLQRPTITGMAAG